MNRTEFLSLSVAIHAILLAAVFMMPVPFPSQKLPRYTEELLYVQTVNLGGPNHAWKKVAASAGFRETLPVLGSKSAHAFAAASPLPAQSAAHTAAAYPAGQSANLARMAAILASQSASRPSGVQAMSSSPPNSMTGLTVPEIKAVAERRATALGLKAGMETVNFKYQEGWPAPEMVDVGVNVPGDGVKGNVSWKVKVDEGWLIVSPLAGTAPGFIRIGVDPGKVAVGFYDATVSIVPSDARLKGDSVEVTFMVLPKEKGTLYLPHYAYDGYMNGNCKVCHLPKELLPSPDFMLKPEFCSLCHNPSGMAKAFVVPRGGHPVGVEAGAGGTRIPTLGTNPKGPWSDMMGTHLPGGRIVCITCHNVMEKPGDYGRSWEPASSDDGVNWWLYKGGWDGMGYMTPKVYLSKSAVTMPKKVRDMERMEVPASAYTYDARDGVITFKKPVPKLYSVYVTLTNPYLRVTTRNNALCYDCHSENTHEGLNCLTCHRIHGGGNAGAVRDVVNTASGARRVYFTGRESRGSFAGGSGSGICEVCHALSGSHINYKGKDCTGCHNHMEGFI